MYDRRYRVVIHDSLVFFMCSVRVLLLEMLLIVLWDVHIFFPC